MKGPKGFTMQAHCPATYRVGGEDGALGVDIVVVLERLDVEAAVVLVEEHLLQRGDGVHVALQVAGHELLHVPVVALHQTQQLRPPDRNTSDEHK
jgi:hypothetical protein